MQANFIVAGNVLIENISLKKQYNMKTLTDEKLTIVGAAGMIGSNMAQTAIMMGLTSNICLYDPYEYGKFLLPPRFLTALSVPKVPTREQ